MPERKTIRGASLSDAIKHWEETDPAFAALAKKSAKAPAAAAQHDPASPSNLDRRADIALHRGG